MEKLYEKKITWTIKNFSTLQSGIIYSDPFAFDGFEWSLRANPKGDSGANNSLSLWLGVANSASLPSEWKRQVNYSLTVVNQFSDKLSKRLVSQDFFYRKTIALGYREMLPLTKLLDKNGGFLVNDEVKIAAEVGIHKATGKTDVVEKTSLVMETMDVNGFQVFPAQVETVKSLFEKHPNITTNVHMKNQYMKTGYMNVLVRVTDMLQRSRREISKENLADANAAVKSLINVGFKLDWLVKELNQVQAKKVKEKSSEGRIEKLEEELKDLKLKHSYLEAQLEKERAQLEKERAPLMFLVSLFCSLAFASLLLLSFMWFSVHKVSLKNWVS